MKAGLRTMFGDVKLILTLFHNTSDCSYRENNVILFVRLVSYDEYEPEK